MAEETDSGKMASTESGTARHADPSKQHGTDYQSPTHHIVNVFMQ